MSEEQDRIFFRNFSVVVCLLALMMFIFFIVARMYGIDEDAEAKLRENVVAERTKPVGMVVESGSEEAMVESQVADEAATAIAQTGDIGQTVYNGLCINCHGLGEAMAIAFPQTGDVDAWRDRVAQGVDVLYDHAINGHTGNMGMMPARGGNPDLSDEEVKAAVDYILAQTPL